MFLEKFAERAYAGDMTIPHSISIAKHNEWRLVIVVAVCLLVAAVAYIGYGMRKGGVDLFTIPNPTAGLKQQAPLPQVQPVTP